MRDVVRAAGTGERDWDASHLLGGGGGLIAIWHATIRAGLCRLAAHAVLIAVAARVRDACCVAQRASPRRGISCLHALPGSSGSPRAQGADTGFDTVPLRSPPAPLETRDSSPLGSLVTHLQSDLAYVTFLFRWTRRSARGA